MSIQWIRLHLCPSGGTVLSIEMPSV
jgi:hypothetical protein